MPWTPIDADWVAESIMPNVSYALCKDEMGEPWLCAKLSAGGEWQPIHPAHAEEIEAFFVYQKWLKLGVCS